MFIRNCPDCGKELVYKNKITYQRALDRNAFCGKCAGKGVRNHFFGKKHDDATRQRMSESDKSYTQTQEFSNATKRGMDGKTNHKPYFDCWVEKYGLEIANQKQADKVEKNRVASSGSSNPMYGKPSPQGAGNGWSGWYKGTYFRSLRELSFIVGTLERFGFEWEGAEKYKVKYIDYFGHERTYRADFLVAGKFLVEIKPKNLWNTPAVSAKKEAGIKLALRNGWQYKLIDPIPLKDNVILKLYNNGQINFLERYETKFREKYVTNNDNLKRASW